MDGGSATILSAAGAALVAVLGAFLKVVRAFLGYLRERDQAHADLQTATNQALRETSRALGEFSSASRHAALVARSSGSPPVAAAVVPQPKAGEGGT